MVGDGAGEVVAAAAEAAASTAGAGVVDRAAAEATLVGASRPLALQAAC